MNPQRGYGATLRKEFKMRYNPSSDHRKAIYERDGSKCAYCGCEVFTLSMVFSMMDELQEAKLRQFRNGEISEKEYLAYRPRDEITRSDDYRSRMATIDHKIPLSKGGTNDPENLITCCMKCNGKKGSIQLENGYTKIANELIEKLAKVKMSGQAWQVLFAIIRKLYGHNKKSDWIEYSQVMEITGLPKSRVCEAVATLRENGIITQKRNGKRQIIEIIKDFDSVPQKRIVPVFRKHRSVKTDSIVPFSRTTKETITKETITKDIIAAEPEPEPSHSKDVADIIDIFVKAGNKTLRFGNITQRTACERLIADLGIQKVLTRARYAVSVQTDRYAPNITTPLELEQKMHKLETYYQREKNEGGGIAIIS